MFTRLMSRVFAGVSRSFLSPLIRTERELKIWLLVLLATFVGLAFFWSNAVGRKPSLKKETLQKTAQMWTCSMHPQIILPHPGKCPICGMDLIPVGGTSHSHGSNEIVFSDREKKLAGISAVSVVRGKLFREIRLSGRVEPVLARDVRIVSTLNALVEKVLIASPGAMVRPGDALFEYGGRNRFRSTVGGLVLSRLIQSGETIREGQELYILQNLDHVWVSLDAYEKEIPDLRSGQSVNVEFDALPGKRFSGVVASVDALLKPESRTASVKMILANPDLLFFPGMTVRGAVSLDTGAGDEILIPATAPLLTGKRALVFIEHGENEDFVYEAREVLLGARNDAFYSVKSGLQTNERVVVEGAFGIDAAMQIQGKQSFISMPQ